jgi:hypothetical protein
MIPMKCDHHQHVYFMIDIPTMNFVYEQMKRSESPGVQTFFATLWGLLKKG